MQEKPAAPKDKPVQRERHRARRGILGQLGGLKPVPFAGRYRVEKTKMSSPAASKKQSDPDKLKQLTPTNNYLKCKFEVQVGGGLLDSFQVLARSTLQPTDHL
jgi:hypothetical protein